MGFVVLPLISQAQVMNPVTPDLLFGMSSVIPAALFGWDGSGDTGRVAVPKCPGSPRGHLGLSLRAAPAAD